MGHEVAEVDVRGEAQAVQQQHRRGTLDDAGHDPAPAGQVEHACGRQIGPDHARPDPAQRAYEPESSTEIGLRTHDQSFARLVNAAYETVVTVAGRSPPGSSSPLIPPVVLLRG